MSDYTASITCTTSAENAYKAIVENMSEWWTPMSAQFLKVGDKAKTGFGGQSYWTFEAITLQKFDRIELKCCEANHLHEDSRVDMKEEWLGTILKFELTENGGETTINFVHEGLMPTLNCYDVCKSGWDHYFLESLKKHLGNGAGLPNTY